MTNRRKNSSQIDPRLDVVLEEFRKILIQTGRVEPKDAVPPIDIDGRIDSGTLSATYTVNELSITIDFHRLGRAMLTVADSVFAETFGPDVVTFGEGSSLRDAVSEYVARSLQWVDGIAIMTLADYFSELVVHGAAFAAESFGKDIVASAKLPWTKSLQKPFRDIARDTVTTLLDTRIPNVGRGGNTRTADVLPDETLIAFHRAIERAYPFWKDVKTRAARGDPAWQTDAKKLPEYRRFKSAERKHADAIITLLQRTLLHKERKINGATADASTLTREHARLIVGLAELSDSKLRQHQRRARAIASAEPHQKSRA